MIAREGVAPLTVAAVVTAVVNGLAGPAWAAPVLLAAVFLGWLFWERRPRIPADPNGVLSPVDGRVIEVASRHDPWLDRSALWISVAVSAPGIVPLRSPAEGRVVDLYARRGQFGEGQARCAPGESPDSYGQWLHTDEGEDIAFVVSSGWPLSRARFDHAPGERLGQGARAGFFYFASRADVLVPDGADARVAPGERVLAGASILARLRRH